MGWGIVYLLAIINLWLDLYSELEIIANDRLSFILIIGQAILYARGASILTPEASDTDTKLYFMENKKAFFLALASIVLCNLFIQLVVHDDLTPIWYRLSLIGLAIFTAFKAKFKVRVALLGMMLLLISIQLLRHGGLFG
jgi:hypothetical protein